MSRRITVPSWVPHGVRVMHEVAELNDAVAERLLTDPRMEQAWRDLRKIPAPADLQVRLASVPAGFSPNSYSDDDLKLSDFDQQTAALFYQVRFELNQPARTYWTEGEAKKLAQPFLDAAKLCDEAARFDVMIGARHDLLEALNLVKAYFEDQGRMRQMQNNPRVLGRRLPEVPDEKRGHSRMVATMIRDLFGPAPGNFPHSAVARFVAVSLDINDEIDELKESVRDWCKNLPPG